MAAGFPVLNVAGTTVAVRVLSDDIRQTPLDNRSVFSPVSLSGSDARVVQTPNHQTQPQTTSTVMAR